MVEVSTYHVRGLCSIQAVTVTGFDEVGSCRVAETDGLKASLLWPMAAPGLGQSPM